MTWKDLGDQIAKMTDEEKKRPAVVAMQQTGQAAEIIAIFPIRDFQEVNLPHQWVMWYERYKIARMF